MADIGGEFALGMGCSLRPASNLSPLTTLSTSSVSPTLTTSGPMSALPLRSPAVETLQQMTSRLADSNLTIDEANVLWPMVQRLVEEISEAGSHAAVPDQGGWPEPEMKTYRQVENRTSGLSPSMMAPRSGFSIGDRVSDLQS